MDSGQAQSAGATAAPAREHWGEVKRIFVEALELPPDRRAELLARECGQDGGLEAEVRRLIAAHEALVATTGDAGRFLDPFDATQAVALLDAGRIVGSYRIVREIGHGGMGTVYLAEREDQYRKRVAIKVLPRGLESRETIRRFLEERQILASLDHPGIAHLHDGGVTDDGLPYYVMEYVEGTSIDRHCDDRCLTIEARLQLVGRVCEAVQYAHRNLVVHRDLKPGNILVTEDGQVKLLDFGIAKLVSRDPAPETTLTRPGARPMTPEYASPEQVLGRPISTASDVYSLGVLLYRLLAGRHPYPVSGRLPHEIEQLVISAEPERPSVAARRAEDAGGGDSRAPLEIARARATTTERLHRQLRGDLDTIVLRVLRKEPELRYASVEQLAADLQRHLHGLPVHALPDTRVYQLRKFLGRHRVSATIAAAFLLLLVGFSVTAQVQSARIRAQARRVALERDKAEQVVQFLTGLFAVSDPGVSRGQSITARELLDRGAGRIQRELAAQPEARAQMMDAMGRAYFGLGLYDPARRLLEDALELRRRAYGSEHADVASTLYQLAYLHRIAGRFKEAEPLYREALATRRRVLGEDHRDVVASLNGLAFLFRGRGDYAKAESLYREALARGRRIFTGPDVLLGHTLNGLGSSISGRGDQAAAEALFREALTVYRAVHGDDHPDVGIAQWNLADVLHKQGKLAAAEPMYREDFERTRRLLGDEHPMMAINMTGLADLLSDMGNHRAAEPLFRKALALQRRALPPRNLWIPTTLAGLATTLHETSRHRESEALVREALDIRLEKAPGDFQTAELQSQLGACLSAQGRYGEAEPLLILGSDGLKARLGERARPSRWAVRMLAEHYERAGNRAQAGKYRQLLDALSKPAG